MPIHLFFIQILFRDVKTGKGGLRKQEMELLFDQERGIRLNC